MRRRLPIAVATTLVVGTALSVPAGAATTPPKTVTLTFVGDTILGNSPRLPADAARYLASMRKQLSAADVTFANLEGTFTSTGPSKCPGGSTDTCYAFRNPPSFARAYAGAGVDVVGLANNHSYDFGAEGLRSTKAAVSDAGMRSTGLPGQVTYLRRQGVRIAFVAFAPYVRTNNLLDLTTAGRLVRQAHGQAPIVVVYMHAGAEGADADHVTGREEHYVGEDRGNPKRFAHMAIDNGASLVVASGPHVLRGMEIYKHRLVAYSLGDFANYRNFSAGGTLSRSLVLHVTLTTRGALYAARLVSVTLATTGHATVGGDSVPFVARLSRQDFGVRAARIRKDGMIAIA